MEVHQSRLYLSLCGETNDDGTDTCLFNPEASASVADLINHPQALLNRSKASRCLQLQETSVLLGDTHQLQHGWVKFKASTHPILQNEQDLALLPFSH